MPSTSDRTMQQHTAEDTPEAIRVDCYDGKYIYVQFANGGSCAYRYGEPWRDCTGDGFILALAQDLAAARAKLDTHCVKVVPDEDTIEAARVAERVRCATLFTQAVAEANAKLVVAGYVEAEEAQRRVKASPDVFMRQAAKAFEASK